MTKELIIYQSDGAVYTFVGAVVEALALRFQQFIVANYNGLMPFLSADKGSGGTPTGGVYNEKRWNLSSRQTDAEMDKKVVKELAESMKKNGWNGPAIEIFEVNGKKIILDGHHRVMAAKEAGIVDIPVRMLNESELLSNWGITPEQLYQEYLSTFW